MENAQLYSTANGMQKRDAKEIIAEFSDRLKWTNDARVLDIGCGTGEVTAAILLPHLPLGFKKIIGLDVSEEMIQHARRIYNHPKLSFVQFDISKDTEDILEELNSKVQKFENKKLESEDKKAFGVRDRIQILLNDREELSNSHVRAEDTHRISSGYDIISSFYCLHWIHNQRLALKNIHRLLKPGGDALLVLLAKSPIFRLYDTLSKYPDWKEYMRDVENFISPYHRYEDPLKEFNKLLHDVGFHPIRLECRETCYTFQDSADLRNAIIAVNPFISRIPNKLRGQFANDCLKEKLLRSPIIPDQLDHIPIQAHV